MRSPLKNPFGRSSTGESHLSPFCKFKVKRRPPDDIARRKEKGRELEEELREPLVEGRLLVEAKATKQLLKADVASAAASSFILVKASFPYEFPPNLLLCVYHKGVFMLTRELV